VVISPPQDDVRRQLGAIVADDGLWLTVHDQQPIEFAGNASSNVCHRRGRDQTRRRFF
jgi:hypothetical protein